MYMLVAVTNTSVTRLVSNMCQHPNRLGMCATLIQQACMYLC